MCKLLNINKSYFSISLHNGSVLSFFSRTGIFFICMLLSAPSYSQTECTAQPSCSSLGYNTEISADCPNDYILYCPFDTNYKKCVLRPCVKLGFTSTDKTSWCSNIVTCPENHALTLCAETKAPSCPTGYSSNLASVEDCGTTGSTGWTYEALTVPGLDGQLLSCGKCSPKTCNGSTAYASVANCGFTGSEGWNYSYCYYGDEKRGTCTEKTCENHGFKSNASDCSSGVYKYATATLGEKKYSCYQCGVCQTRTILQACKVCSTKRIKNTTPTTPSGYYGTCKNSNYFVCCNANEICSGRCPTDINPDFPAVIL